jgi:hypothetical protein
MGKTEEVDDLIRLTDRLAVNLWPNIVQLFAWNQEMGEKPDAVGSGVLVRYEDRVLVFSAAHVLSRFKTQPVWIPVGEEVVTFAGEHRYQLSGSPAMGNHDHDPLDAAVCLLPSGSHADLVWRALDLRMIKPFAPTEKTLYLLLGHPANRTSVDRVVKDIASERMPLVFPELAESDYIRMGYSRDTHLLLRWQKLWKTPTGRRHARRLAGSSGGGIWAFDWSVDSVPQLVATFTEVPQVKGGKAHVGTRVAAHLLLASELLKQVS